MAIWFRDYTLEEANRRGKNTMVEHLGIEVMEIGDEFVQARMPVDHRTRQPEGILHGGASVALAESLASIAANMVLDHCQQYAVGLEINANHIRACRDGFVIGVATPLHLGKSTQVWEMRIRQENRLICVSRMTLAILNRQV